jgi:hypothetical protein
MILTDPVLDVVRRELRRVSPEVRIETEEIKTVLTSEVIKREVLEGEKAEEARRKIARSAGKSLRAALSRERILDHDGSTPAERVEQREALDSRSVEASGDPSAS